MIDSRVSTMAATPQHRNNPFAQGLILLLGLALCAVAQAQTWPQKPVRMVVGYPPSGTTDVAGRLLAERMSRSLGQQVVVDNRAGAGGMIGALSVVHADPDGYTLLLAASPEVSIAPVTVKAMQYDPAKDLIPITLVGQVPFLLVANPAFPPNTVAELIAYAKTHRGQVNYSSFGNNTSNHLGGELFKLKTGIDATHVPYKGSGPSIIDVMAGQIQYTFDAPPAVLNQVRAGKLKALAIAAAKRLPGADSVPTMAEAGVPGFTAGTWFGLLAPAKTPRAVIERINAAAVAEL
ncbi:MAG TPA: tripartite tricarboxylate transporter substrate-binding protein, partial [Burkholderiales bacterium]|nr:tripartite tricarboxylate transporter substrate-binding protein [Burkholderiales bacterium]